MISCDIKNMYNSIPIDKVIDIVIAKILRRQPQFKIHKANNNIIKNYDKKNNNSNFNNIFIIQCNCLMMRHPKANFNLNFFYKYLDVEINNIIMF